MQARRNTFIELRKLCQSLHSRGIELQFQKITEIEKQIRYNSICRRYGEFVKFKLEMLEEKLIYIEKYYENFNDESLMRKDLFKIFA